MLLKRRTPIWCAVQNKIRRDAVMLERVTVGRIHLQIVPELRHFGEAEIEQIHISVSADEEDVFAEITICADADADGYCALCIKVRNIGRGYENETIIFPEDTTVVRDIGGKQFSFTIAQMSEIPPDD
jgi:hypothetical protein